MINSMPEIGTKFSVILPVLEVSPPSQQLKISDEDNESSFGEDLASSTSRDYEIKDDEVVEKVHKSSLVLNTSQSLGNLEFERISESNRASPHFKSALVADKQ